MEKKSDNPGPPISLGCRDISELPSDLFFEILLRLPKKTIIRLRSISKTWNSLISSPEMINAHIIKSCNNQEYTRHNLIFKLCGLKQQSLHSVLYGVEPKATDVNHSLGRRDSIKIVGSCNGLVCLVVRKEILLWNPSIRKSRILPFFERRLKSRHPKVYGFWYDESTDDYLVVEIWMNHGQKKKKKSWVNVYSRNTGSWRCIEDFKGDFPKQVVDVVNGKLHWTANLDGGRKIVSFDLANGTYGEVNQPNYGVEDSFDWSLEALGGCLCVCCYYPSKRVDFWTMRQDGVREFWTRVVLVPEYSEHWYGYFKPLFLSKDGEILFQFMSKYGEILFPYMSNKIKYSELVIHCPRTGILRIPPYPWLDIHSDFDGVIIHVDSLVLHNDPDAYSC